MSHYFINDENLESKPRIVSYKINDVTFNLCSDLGVFSKNKLDMGTEILIKSLLPINLGNKLLDMGCGIGPIGLTLAYFKPNLKVTASDVNNRALSLFIKNTHTLALCERVTCLQSDVYEKIEGLYDSIVSNPPLRAGKKITYQIYLGAKDHLIEGGSLYIVIRKAQGALSVKEYLNEIYGNVTILERKKGYYILKATKVKNQ